MLDNMNVAFKMLEQAEIVVPFLNPSQIVDCNEKMVMGLLWALIYEFQIKPSLLKERGNSLESLIISTFTRKSTCFCR